MVIFSSEMDWILSKWCVSGWIKKSHFASLFVLRKNCQVQTEEDAVSISDLSTQIIISGGTLELSLQILAKVKLKALFAKHNKKEMEIIK